MRNRLLGWMAACLMASGITLPAHAAGYFVPRADSGESADNAAGPEQAFWVEDSDETTLYIQASVRGTLTDFAWILPLPATPTRVEEAPEDLFRLLDDLTAPQLLPQTTHSVWEKGCFGESDSPEVYDTYAAKIACKNMIGLSKQTAVSDFAFEVLDSHTEAAILEWLSQSGYAASAEQQESMSTYISEDSAFLAVKVTRGTGYRFPALALHFPPNTALAYPLRPAMVPHRTDPMSFLLYTAGHLNPEIKENPTFKSSVPEIEHTCTAVVRNFAEDTLSNSTQLFWLQLRVALESDDLPSKITTDYTQKALARHALIAASSGEKIFRAVATQWSSITLHSSDYSKESFDILFPLFTNGHFLARWNGVVIATNPLDDLIVETDLKSESFRSGTYVTKSDSVHTSNDCHLIQQYNLGLFIVGLGLAVFFAWRRRRLSTAFPRARG